MAKQIEEKPENTERPKVMWPQWTAGIGGMLLLMQLGMMTGWTSPYIAYLTSPNSYLPITMTEASWVISLLNLGRLAGAILGSTGVNYFGSKRTLSATTVPMSFSWIFTIVANRVEWFYAARFIGGIAIGMVQSSFAFYIGEIADPSIRGALISIAITGVPIGTLLISIFGAYLSIMTSGIICLFCSAILTILFWWLPESPYYFMRKKDEERAKSSILWYHRNCDIDRELSNLRRFIEQFNDRGFIDTLKEFRTPQIMRASLLVVVLLMYAQMCGLNNVLFYMETILRKAKVTVIDPSLVVIIVMVAAVCASILSIFLIDRYGRRFLMLVSCFGLSVSLTALGIVFELLERGYNPADIEWLPIVAMNLFEISACTGVFSVPNAMIGEIFPPNVKCVAACISSTSVAVFAFISTSTYQPLIDLMNDQYVFWLYAVILFSAIPYTLVFLPETKGRSLQEIQEQLVRKSSQKS